MQPCGLRMDQTVFFSITRPFDEPVLFRDIPLSRDAAVMMPPLRQHWKMSEGTGLLGIDERRDSGRVVGLFLAEDKK